ncbi:MAG: ABC-F family ATP-binding cassette domain-containing protein [Acidobacteriota bacterium]
MALLLSTRAVSKSYGAQPLFKAISLNIQEGDRLAIIGPNGSGKSTLLEILAGKREPDNGEVVARKGTRLAYVAQDSHFKAGSTIRTILRDALERAKVPQVEWQARESEELGRAGFVDPEAEASTLSGGWRKRLAVVEALVQGPQILLLDEPTNHLDLTGISWIEKLLRDAPFAVVTVSHDRYFLENVPTAIAELSRAYPDDLFQAPGNYSAFLERKSLYLEAQAKHQDALENRVKIEIEWLRRGPKARATKAKARIDNANLLIGELSDSKSRSRTTSANFDFVATGRQTKRLIHLENVTHGFTDSTGVIKPLVKDLTFTITAGTRIGLVGENGSGKTTLLRLLRGEVEPLAGEVQKADGLRIVYFNQTRTIDPTLTLRRALAPDSDSVIFRDQVIHVASWASRFLFTSEQLNQPVGRLSGGERARVLIACLMLEPADVLLLDEPTNDLDIPTLEILEESLLDFPGALILVTHDRYLLDRVSTVVLGLDGKGGTQRFADYSQWDVWQSERKQAESRSVDDKQVTPKASDVRQATSKKKLSYIEAREYDAIENQVGDAEMMLDSKRQALEDPEVTKDGRLVAQAVLELEQAQDVVDRLYARWAELEGKLG